MFLNKFNNKEELLRVIENELKICGIKFRRDKNAKIAKKHVSNKIFSVSLDMLELTQVNINGEIVPIPKFVYDACNFITANINTEGLFRKAGSSKRQKQIKANLEKGQILDKQYNVIDVANILKSFFRDLPEPMIPPGNAQDSMLKCLISTDKKVNNLLLTCLLMQPLTLNTMAYFMKFLKNISEYSYINKMTIENLSIIFAPGLMPLNQLSEERLNGHVRVMCLLIENASKIGIIPEYILIKIQNINMNHKNKTTTKSTRKVRRSGSLTRMFNGLRKIVGGIGSSENINDISPESAVVPCINKSVKKRALETPVFSAKKKRNILTMQQQCESTPIIKKYKLSPSLVVKGKIVNNLINKPDNLNRQTRRWSNIESPQNFNQNCEYLEFTSSSIPHSHSNKNDLDVNHSFSNEITVQSQQSVRLRRTSLTKLKSIEKIDPHVNLDIKSSNDQYIEIKERVISLEKRISEEFKSFSNYESICHEEGCINANGPEKVQNKFEQILEKTEILNENSISGQLANHLTEELRIRNKSDRIILRSPSARKIGTIRRKSRELMVPVKSRKSNNIKQNDGFTDNITNELIKPTSNTKTNLKRGKPNTVTTGLTHSVPLIKEINILALNRNSFVENVINFNNVPKVRKSLTNVQLNNCTKTNAFSLGSPIKSEFGNLPSIAQTHRKQKLILSNSKPSMRSSLLTKTMNLHLNGNEGVNLFPEIKEDTGRSSIARLRTQNFGMVSERAKLFNEMSNTKI